MAVALITEPCRGEVADGKDERAGEAAGAGDFGRHDDLAGIDRVLLLQDRAEPCAALASLPGIQRFVQRPAFDREHLCNRATRRLASGA
jgi:hypothetical protein